MLVVHPHFHRRRTGVTTHTEAVVETLARTDDARALGQALKPQLPRIGWAEVWRRTASEAVVWHAHRNNELLLGWLLRVLRRRLKLVFTRHGGTPPGRFSRWVMRLADTLVTLNPELAAMMPATTTVVPHGVDLARFVPPEDRRAAWARLGLPGARGIGVVGRVREAKGQGDFVDALAPLLAERGDVTPVLVGLVKRADEAWAHTLQARLPSLVLPGESLDVVPWYQGLDVVVQPSHSEAFSLVIPEAMACGCAVVCTRLAATPLVVEEGRTGFMYPPGDVAGLREVLARLLREPELVAKVGAAAAEEARARLGIEHEVAKLRALYAATLTPP